MAVRAASVESKKRERFLNPEVSEVLFDISVNVAEKMQKQHTNGQRSVKCNKHGVYYSITMCQKCIFVYDYTRSPAFLHILKE